MAGKAEEHDWYKGKKKDGKKAATTHNPEEPMPVRHHRELKEMHGRHHVEHGDMHARHAKEHETMLARMAGVGKAEAA